MKTALIMHNAVCIVRLFKKHCSWIYRTSEFLRLLGVKYIYIYTCIYIYIRLLNFMSHGSWTWSSCDGFADTGFTLIKLLNFTGFWVAWIAFGLRWFEAWIHWKFNWVFICCGFKLYSAHRFPCAWQNTDFSLRIGGHKCFVKLRWTCLLLTSDSLPRWGVAVGSWWLHFWKLRMFMMNLELQKRFQQHLWSRSM